MVHLLVVATEAEIKLECFFLSDQFFCVPAYGVVCGPEVIHCFPLLLECNFGVGR